MTEQMRTVRFHEYGEPKDVLRLETAPVPEPGPERIRILVRAAGLAPADWALARGLFAGSLPRGIGCDVAGIVDAIGADVAGVEIGDAVFGTADWANSPSAGASEKAVMNRWFPIPSGLDFPHAAALPMTVDTAYLHLQALGLDEGRGKTILIHGGGTTIGFAAVQIALLRGMRVIATAGATYAQQLRDFGALVTHYGEGVVARVAELAEGPVDLVLDTSPVGGSLRDLIKIAGDDPQKVLTISDFQAAAELGARATFTEDFPDRVEALPEFSQLTAEGKFQVPIAATFPLEGWSTALEISLGGNARGKLVLLPEGTPPVAVHG